jgi:hypothetical protein
VAHRFRDIWVDPADALDPTGWNRNMSALAEEWNGGLDQDNLPEEVVTTARIEQDQCTVVSSDGYAVSGAVNRFTVDILRSDWQRTDATGNVIGEEEINCPVDGTLIAEWGGWWYWDGGSAGSSSVCRFRLVVDGRPISESGWSEWARRRDAVQLVGASPLSAGRHTIWVEVQAAHVDPQDPWAKVDGTSNNGDIYVNHRELVTDVRLR